MSANVDHDSESARLAVVTGAAQGIGLGIARRLAADGRCVALIDLDVRRAEDAAARLGMELGAEPGAGLYRGYACDVSSEAAVSETAERIAADFGRPIQILVNNAGICPSHDGKALPVESMPLAEWNQVLGVNLTGVFLMSRAVIPGMRRAGWGRIINISSMGGRLRSLLSGAAYASTKAGMIGFTRVLAGELGPDGITANCIAPGRIETQQSDDFGGLDAFLQQLPMRRLGRPADIAGAVAFLSSEDASFVTGTVIDVNGGHFMP